MTLAEKVLSVDDSRPSDGIDNIGHNIKRAGKRERDFEEATRASSIKRFCFVLSVSRTIYLASERDGLATPLTRGLVEQDHRVLDAGREAPSGCQYSEVVCATDKAVTGYVR